MFSVKLLFVNQDWIHGNKDIWTKCCNFEIAIYAKIEALDYIDKMIILLKLFYSKILVFCLWLYKNHSLSLSVKNSVYTRFLGGITYDNIFSLICVTLILRTFFLQHGRIGMKWNLHYLNMPIKTGIIIHQEMLVLVYICLNRFIRSPYSSSKHHKLYWHMVANLASKCHLWL